MANIEPTNCRLTAWICVNDKFLRLDNPNYSDLDIVNLQDIGVGCYLLWRYHEHTYTLYIIGDSGRAWREFKIYQSDQAIKAKLSLRIQQRLYEHLASKKE